MNFKRFETARARAALLGVELRAVRNDLERVAFIATQGALTREFSTLADAEACLANPARLEAVLLGVEGIHG